MAKITRKDAEKFLAKVPDQYMFRCNDSCIMSDLKELAQQLNRMSDETYNYHANETKNDFANWVSDVIGDQELAASLRRAASQAQAAKSVADRVAFLGRRAA